GLQHPTRLFDAADAAGDAERDVQLARHAFHPVDVDTAPFRAGGDVVEHQLVGAFVTIAPRQFDDVAAVDVVTESHALDHAAIAHVEAGNDAPAQHVAGSLPARSGNSRGSAMAPSSSARPSTTFRHPAASASWTSATLRRPPDAWISS